MSSTPWIPGSGILKALPQSLTSSIPPSCSSYFISIFLFSLSNLATFHGSPYSCYPNNFFLTFMLPTDSSFPIISNKMLNVSLSWTFVKRHFQAWNDSARPFILLVKTHFSKVINVLIICHMGMTGVRIYTRKKKHQSKELYQSLGAWNL